MPHTTGWAAWDYKGFMVEIGESTKHKVSKCLCISIYCISIIELIFLQKEIQRTQSTLQVVCEAQNKELTLGKAFYTKIVGSATSDTQQAVGNIISTQSYNKTLIVQKVPAFSEN